ncbi:nucleoside hydrolase-like [Uranotaenia lowii]|uniref:nucleoside hydrolase-like n=1 Tax=Uranotaenia lowii TaxID=190385 RepID=UPI00247B1952|nr:nucleoside hydrolase-like [Uranotaenia lowii]
MGGIIVLLLMTVGLFVGELEGRSIVSAGESGLRRVIIDLDAGGDDAWALTMLLMNEQKFNLKVEAITCSHGNGGLENVARNVARILEGLGRCDVPVFKGASERLITPAPPRDVNGYFWGVDGFGDVEFEKEPDMSVVKPGHAVLKMQELLDKFPNEITIISVGPLTNLALLLKMFPESGKKISNVFILGGNRNAVGNTDFSAEFNFFTDPEAANIVINNSPVTLQIFPWESVLAMNRYFSIEWRFEFFNNTKNQAIQVLNAVENSVYEGGSSWWDPCDMYTVAIFLNQSLIVESEDYKADVELRGHLTRGMLTLQHHIKNAEHFNVNIIDRIDADQVKEMIMDLNRDN